MRLGIGPVWGGLSCAYLAATVGVHYAWPEAFGIPHVPYLVFAVAGGALIVAGVGVYIACLPTFRKGFKHGVLVTDGPYAWVRHPLYATWVVLIVPGIALVFGSWLVLTAPVVTYGLFRAFIGKEERVLEQEFGQAYREYQARVPQVFPRLWQYPDPHAG